MKIRQLFNSILGRAGVRIIRIRRRGDEKLPSYIDSDFVESYRKYVHDSVVPWEGMYDAFLAATHIAKSGTPGDIVECGVFRGGVVALMRDTILRTEKTMTGRNFWLFDTFDGMPKPGPKDFKIGRDRNAPLKKYERSTSAGGAGGSGWVRSELWEVENTVRRSGAGLANTIFVQGMVEETLRGELLPDKIALLRLDTDFYESTKIELEVLLPRLSVGGVLIVDDYGDWAGSRDAVHETFLDLNNFAMFINHRYGALVAVKTAE